jgi:hypothetical protein
VKRAGHPRSALTAFPHRKTTSPVEYSLQKSPVVCGSGWEITATLEHPTAALFEGWDKASRQYDATRRVAIVYEDFVVVVAMGLKQDGSLKANFVTCYQADNSIGKIRSSPAWSRAACLRLLGGGP